MLVDIETIHSPWDVKLQSSGFYVTYIIDEMEGAARIHHVLFQDKLISTHKKKERKDELIYMATLEKSQREWKQKTACGLHACLSMFSRENVPEKCSLPGTNNNNTAKALRQQRHEKTSCYSIFVSRKNSARGSFQHAYFLEHEWHGVIRETQSNRCVRFSHTQNRNSGRKQAQTMMECEKKNWLDILDNLILTW